MKTDEWIEALKPCDKVIVERNNHGVGRVASVLRVTKTQISLVGGSRFTKSNRLVGGDSWSQTRLVRFTEEKAEAIAHAGRCEHLRHVEWRKHSPSVVLACYTAVITADKAAEQEGGVKP